MVMATFLADVLREAGLSVVEHEGWKTRGRGPLSAIKGIICHHTAGPAAPKGGPTPALNLVLNGRADLPGPLSQLYLARDGTYHVLAAGRCNHAGAGAWRGIQGNSTSIGIEAENAGDGKDPWPAAQMDAYAKGVAAILKRLKLSPEDACGHKEFAQPRGRKIDPSFDMSGFRGKVRGQMMSLENQTVTIHVTSTPIPPTNPSHAMLKKGDKGDDVRLLQDRLEEGVDGIFGPATEAAVKAFQAANGLTADGLVGPKTWAALGV